MHHLIRTLFLLLMLTVQSTSFAGGYAGVGYVFSEVEPDNTSSSADVQALQFHFGSWFNSEGTFGGEFRAALGTSDDDINNVDVEIDRFFGAYLRGQFPNSMPLRPYGLIGLTRVETTEKAGGSSDDENYNGLSLGVGAEFTIQNNVFVSMELLSAVDSGGEEVQNFTLGIGGRF